MVWLYVLVIFLLIVLIALFLGSLDGDKHPVRYAFGYIGAILLLLVIGTWDRHPLILAVLFLMALLRGLEHIPRWLIYTVLTFGIVFGLRYILTLKAQSILDVGTEVKKINARLQLMEQSMKAKLDEIANRLPKPEEHSER
jgi:branched-subunit amino acid permease